MSLLLFLFLGVFFAHPLYRVLYLAYHKPRSVNTFVVLRLFCDTFVVKTFDRKSHNSLLLSSNMYRAGNLSGLLQLVAETKREGHCLGNG